MFLNNNCTNFVQLILSQGQQGAKRAIFYRVIEGELENYAVWNFVFDLWSSGFGDGVVTNFYS